MESGIPACGDSKCYLDCVYVPPGCHVVGANSSTDCSNASCGTIVCPALDAGSEGGAAPSFDAGPASNTADATTDTAPFGPEAGNAGVNDSAADAACTTNQSCGDPILCCSTGICVTCSH
jgi:hypothetical protein